MDTYDVFLTMGDPDVETLGAMIEAVTDGLAQPNTIATGEGQWGDYNERSAFLLWTGIPGPLVDVIRIRATAAAVRTGQDAIGFLSVPAGLALVPCKARQDHPNG